jgi:hypothetical protein
LLPVTHLIIGITVFVNEQSSFTGPFALESEPKIVVFIPPPAPRNVHKIINSFISSCSAEQQGDQAPTMVLAFLIYYYSCFISPSGLPIHPLSSPTFPTPQPESIHQQQEKCRLFINLTGSINKVLHLRYLTSEITPGLQPYFSSSKLVTNPDPPRVFATRAKNEIFNRSRPRATFGTAPTSYICLHQNSTPSEEPIGKAFASAQIFDSR